MKKTSVGSNLLTLAVVALTLSLVIYPQEAFEASVHGMQIFWSIVFPSLLPFFVLSEIMLGMGVVHFIGVLFEPLMRPLFGVPGVGAFALSMGLAAGYPMDAVITGKFRRARLCNRVEGERMLAFTNTADPLFMFGAVAVGMFGRPELGVILAAAHYLSAFTVGLLFKLHGRGQPQTTEAKPPREGILSRAAAAMYRARAEDGRGFGQLMGEAVNESVRTLLMIGGFIMTFSVLIRIITVAGWAPVFAWPLEGLFRLLGISPALVPAALQGVFEIDLGTVAASKSMAPFAQQVMIASAVIAWSGLSVHGQVASVVTGTDIRMGPYVVARVLHAVLAAALAVMLLGPARPSALAVAAPLSAWTPVPGAGMPPFWEHLETSALKAVLVPAVLTAFPATLVLFRSARVVWFWFTR